MFETIGNFFRAIASVFGFVSQRDQEKNSPAVQAAAAAQKEQDAEDRTRQGLGNVDEERRELAE